MSNTIQVSAARIPDRDRLLRELGEAGLTAKAVDELGIVVDCADGDDASNEIFAPRRARDHEHRRLLRAHEARRRDLHPPAGRMIRAAHTAPAVQRASRHIPNRLRDVRPAPVPDL